MADDKSSKLELLKMLIESESSSGEPFATEDKQERLDRLKKLQQSLAQKHNFAVGMIVIWKAGLKNRKKPLYGEPAIVTQILPEPVHGKTDESGSPYFREPLDIVLGSIDKDDELTEHYFDSRRFEPLED